MSQEITHNSLQGEFLFYKTQDGKTKIEVQIDQGTTWLSQAQMAELLETTRPNITMHISNIFNEGELEEDSVCKESLHTASDGKSYKIKLYNLDMIISVGYRVKSSRGTQFRIWATEILKEYIVKGFSMNDDLLKSGGNSTYFEELLARIRDIRSSERVFYKKVLDIFATSVDYNGSSEVAREFFAVVQNKFHYAAYKHTAAEIIYERVDSSKKNLGMTNFIGKTPTKQETHVAKNYLNEEELNKLNRLVTLYIEFAELQALNRNAITMNDHIKQIDNILKMTNADILDNAGTIGSKLALKKADEEYQKYKNTLSKQKSQVEEDMEKSIAQLEQIAKKIKK